MGRWDLAQNYYEPGAWFHGRIFPRRSDLSPDGRWLCYFADKPVSTWEHGQTYIAVSKLPWLTALQAWGTCGTWTRGYVFSEPGNAKGLDTAALPLAYALCPMPAIQFALERQRGWNETPDSPPRSPNDLWDQYRNARLLKPQPQGQRVLYVESVGLH